jgi:RecA-family ATPase
MNDAVSNRRPPPFPPLDVAEAERQAEFLPDEIERLARLCLQGPLTPAHEAFLRKYRPRESPSDEFDRLVAETKRLHKQWEAKQAMNKQQPPQTPKPLPVDDGQPPPDDTEDDIDREERDLARRIVAAPALARDPEPQRKWIVEDVIPDENLTLVTGEGGIGKTTLMLQLAADMQTGGDWLGLPVAQGPALFVTSEDDRKDVNFNLRVILKARGKSLAHCEGLHVISLADRDACLAAAATRLAPVTATPLWQALVRVIERLAPRIVIFDALADLFGGEENARRHVRGFIVLLKRLAIKQGLGVVLIAHPSLSGINTGSGLSGSTDWHNGPRARLYFERPKSRDDKAADDHDARTLTVKKVQWAREGTVFKLRRKAGFFVYEGREGGSAPYDRAAASAKADRVFLALLTTFTEQGRSVSPNLSRTYAPTVFEGEDDAEGVSKKAFTGAMGRLLKANRIHVETVGPPSRQRKTLAPGPDPAKATEPEGQEVA